MPDWLLITLAIVGSAVGVGSPVIAWWSIRHKAPIERGTAIAQSYDHSISLAEKRHDSAEVERLGLEAAAQEEAFRETLRSRTPSLSAKAYGYSPTEYRVVEETLAKNLSSVEDVILGNQSEGRGEEKEAAERGVARALLVWEQAQEAFEKVTNQFVASGLLGAGGEIPLPPRVLDVQGIAEIQQAEAIVEEKLEAHQQAIANWRSHDTKRQARLERGVHALLQVGRLPRREVELIIGTQGFVGEEISEVIERLITTGIVREWHGGRYLSLTDV